MTVALLALAAPAGAAAPGDILVADYHAFSDLSGGVIRVDPQSGMRTVVSANTSPAGGPSFKDPTGLALAANGDILVADPVYGGLGMVIRVDPQSGARTVLSANTSPAGEPTFANPNALVQAADGSILVTDADAFGGGGGIIRVDPQTGVRTRVSANTAPAGGPDFAEPAGIALAPNGDILVADFDAFGGTGGVIRVDPQGGARTTVSANSAPAGGPNFEDPTGLALAPNGDILVADPNAIDAFGFTSGGIIRVDPQTGARTRVSANGAPAGGTLFQGPRGIALAADGSILVADEDSPGQGGVIRVDPQTGARTTVSAAGSPAGAPNFTTPWGIAVEPPSPVAPPAAPAAPPAAPAPTSPSVPADAFAPRLSGLLVSNRRFRVGRAATPLAARRTPIGTHFGFTLSEPATVRITVQRVLAGRRAGGRCVRPTPRLRARPRCTRFVAVGALTRQARAGRNRVVFSGRLGRRALQAGRYRARLSATDTAGNRSTTYDIGFRVVGR